MGIPVPWNLYIEAEVKFGWVRYDSLIFTAPVKLFSSISTQRSDFDTVQLIICTMLYQLYISKAANINIPLRIWHFVTIEKFSTKSFIKSV